MRNSSIDAIKGVLILTVILGHVLVGNIDNNIARYIIYSFHMPVFFFISGYLINTDTLSMLSIRQLLSKYWKRMMAMWCVAWVIYTAYVVYGHFNVGYILSCFYNPYYHLWFVPSLFMMIVIVWILTKKQMFHSVSIAILLMIGILLFNLAQTKYTISSAWNCSMLPFFLLGLISRKYLKKMTRGGGGILLLYFIAIVIINICINNTISFYRTYLMLPMVGLLCIMGLLPIIHTGRFHCGILEFWGRNSLPIYLWHVAPIIVFKWVWSDDTTTYYLVSSIVMILFAIISYFHNKKLVI